MTDRGAFADGPWGPVSPSPEDGSARERILGARRRVPRATVVLDDDPTGSQSVHGVQVVTALDPAEYRSAMTDPVGACFALTNSRSLSGSAAAVLAADVADALFTIAAEEGLHLELVSRSDSTLRGHLMAEVRALDEARTRALGHGYDAVLLAPAFIEAGRVTVDDVHWARVGARFQPVGETEFARDVVFGYRSSNLREFVAERSDGRVKPGDVGGHLWLLGTAAELAAFASGGGGYATDPAPEPYLALSTGATVAEAGCAFGRDEVYALEPGGNPGVVAVDTQGRARRVADLPGVTPNGIAFDDVGRFGHRLLVTAAAKGGATVYAVDCAGTVTVIASHGPTVEGGIAVAPASFGDFGGDLIAPDENSGQIWAIGRDGDARVVARSGLPSGGDIGVESAGFVPADFTRDWAAYVADRRSAGNPHPGNDSILQLSGAMLAASDVRPGDLIVASEGGAQTVAVRCAATCTVRHIVDGPAIAHVEGHLVFAPPR